MLTKEFVEAQTKPDDHLFNIRAYPHNHIDVPSFQRGVQQRKRMREENLMRNVNTWEAVGPNNVGGRITDVIIHPQNPAIQFAGSSVGGIFKSTDAGRTWFPIFDEATSASIGNLAISESNPDVIYAGTGEANGSATSGAFFGDGVYKSTDAGNTWEHMGLENSQHVGRIVIDPNDENHVFVAAAGLLYGKNDDRGLYETVDGGLTWENIFFVSDSTACIDVAINPQNPEIIYTVSWERTRRPWARDYGGVSSGIWRSEDGGDNWEKLSNGLPVSDEETGRIGIAIAKSNPNILYASYTTNSITNVFDGIYKTTDGGDTWDLVNDQIQGVFSSFGWFFGNVRINPFNPNDVFVLGQTLFRSLDGGFNFSNVTQNMHVDFHALEYDPTNPQNILIGCDGGLYFTENDGTTYEKIESLPNMQFYNCEIDELDPSRIFGGAQDNGTVRTEDNNPDGYQRILGGDGFHVAVNPVNNDIVYAEFQFGNFFKSEDGGETFDRSDNGIDPSDRTNWNSPFLIDPSIPSQLYFGTNKLYKSVDDAENWFPISEDLSKGLHESGSQSYGTILTIAVAETNSDYIMVGTDDGNVQITLDGGSTWENVSGSLPDRAVSQVAFDPLDESIVYVTLSGYRNVDYIPHVLRSPDNGQTWEDISGNLPEVPVNDIIVNATTPKSLIIANDIGVYISYDDGAEWELLGNTLPLSVVNDLRFHRPTNTLLAATFGRSMFTYTFDDAVSSVETSAKSVQSMQVYPMPVRERTSITFDLQESGSGRLQLFNIQGQLVQTIAEANFTSGKNLFEWTPDNVMKGNYFIRLEINKQAYSKKIIVH